MSGVIHIINLEQDDLDLLKEKGIIYHDIGKGKIEIRFGRVIGN